MLTDAQVAAQVCACSAFSIRRSLPRRRTMRLRDKHRYVASLKQSTRVWGVRVDLVRALDC